MNANILIAGFGGQGVLFAGKLLAYKGMLEGKNVSWLPSYVPEMRGGTANCSVILSDDAVGSPIVNEPDILIVMNLPSLDKYESAVVPGGKIFVDSTLIGRRVNRTDVETTYIPATAVAKEIGAPTLANMVMIGRVLKETGIVDYNDIEAGLKKVVSARHQDLLEINKNAIAAGYTYE